MTPKRHAAAAAILAAALLAAGACGSGSAIPYTGRLLVHVLMPMPDGTSTSALSAPVRQALAAQGVQVDDQRNALVSPADGLPGYWVKVSGDDAWYMTDATGTFNVPKLASTDATVAFYHQLDDAEPEVSFPLARTGAPPTYTLELTLPMPGDMNADVTAAAQLGVAGFALADGCPDHCDAADAAAKANAATGCCLDYDGPAGDGLRRARTGSDACKQKAYLNFPLSTCFNWSVAPNLHLACHDEAAYQCFPSVVAADTAACSQGLPAPACQHRAQKCQQGKWKNCWNQHKYRNCQNMNVDDLKLVPGLAVVPPGGTVDLTLRNNTDANSTIVSFAEGTLQVKTSGPGSGTVAGGLRVDHWNDAQRKHFENVDLQYTAPAVPANTCKTIELTAQAAGKTVAMSVVVEQTRPPPKTWKPGAKKLVAGGPARRWGSADACSVGTPTALAIIHDPYVCGSPPFDTSIADLNVFLYGDVVTCAELLASTSYAGIEQVVQLGPSQAVLWAYKENANLLAGVPPVGEGTYDLTATPGAGAQYLATDASCNLVGFGAAAGGAGTISGTFTVSAIGAAVQGRIDGVVNGEAWAGPFEATLCDPPAPVCPFPVPPPFTCTPPAVAAAPPARAP